jgi:O-acetylserine/cysteine efflux transporter
MDFDRRRAVAALTAAGLLWGTTVPLSKLALGWLAPGWLTFVRFGFAAAILLPAARHRLRGACTLPVLASGAAGYGGSVVVQNAGITRTSVSHAALLVGAVPVLVAVIAALWHRAVARPVAWAGFAVSLAGIGLVTGGGGGGATAVGDGLVLTSLLLSATFTVAQTRLLHGRDPVAVTAVQFLGAAVAVLPFSAATEGMPTAPGGPGAVLAAIGLTAGGTLLPFTLFAYAQSRVSAEVAGAFLNLEPLVGAVAGVAIFGDPAGLRQLAGGAAILAGIALSSLPLLGTGRRPAPERHDQRQQSTRELRRLTTVTVPAARRCDLAAGSPAPAAARHGRACRYGRTCRYAHRRAFWPRFPCWSRRSRPGTAGPQPKAAPVRAHRNEVRLRRLHAPNATSAAARTAHRAALASRCGRIRVSGGTRSAPRRRARLSPPSRINSSWFHLNAGLATGASRFIHRLVV